jgi:hypothetical protein
MPSRVAPWIVALLLACVAGLAWSAARRDSVTVDEPAHLVAGYASLITGDFRLSPDHPPLARALLALPLLLQPVAWRPFESPAWNSGDFLTLGRTFLEEWNDGQRLTQTSRMVAIALLLALLLAVGAVARDLHGPAGALLAMSIAAFDPAWLAHGHLATIDVPFALAALLTLFTAHRWLEKSTAARLALFVASFAATALIKFSWPTVVPALIAMAFVARRGGDGHNRFRTLAIGGGALVLGTVLAIWAAYGFRFAAISGVTTDGAGASHIVVPADYGQPPPRTSAAAWETVLHDPATAADRRGPIVPLLRAAHAHRLLPEAYLYGIAFVEKKAQGRAAYLRGLHSNSGFPSYFSWALAVKTPLPCLLLFSCGLVLSARRPRGGRPRSTLALGLAVFAITYFALLSTSGLNLGYRHLLPVTAVLAIATGSLAPAVFAPGVSRWLRAALALLLAWLVAGTLAAAPHWIGYFNEAVGGWRHGHRYLADSNLDWGQDLLRLRARLAREPAGTAVWLSQAGDPPLPPGLAVRWYLGQGSHSPDPTPIGDGLYVISATDLVAVYRPLARAESWRDPRLLARYEQAASAARARRPLPTTTGEPSLAGAIDEFEALRRLRLLSLLASRPPDERIGTSLFLFRLSEQQVAEWTTP